MGNRGFLPGLLADARTYFRLGFLKRLSALALPAYKELVETSLLDRVRGKKMELYLLIAFPSLFFTGFYSVFHTSGGRGRRVQLQLVMAIAS